MSKSFRMLVESKLEVVREDNVKKAEKIHKTLYTKHQTGKDKATYLDSLGVDGKLLFQSYTEIFGIKDAIRQRESFIKNGKKASLNPWGGNSNTYRMEDSDTEKLKSDLVVLKKALKKAENELRTKGATKDAKKLVNALTKMGR